MTTNVKIRAIANSGELRPEYLPTAVVSPITIALWLLGMPPVSARTRRLSRRWRNEYRVSLAICAMPHAIRGARRYLTRTAILRFRPRVPGARPGATAPRRAVEPPADGRRRARPAAPCRRPASRWSTRGRRAGRRKPGPDSSRGRGHPAQDSVHETTGLIARKRLRQLNRLVDRGLGRHAA